MYECCCVQHKLLDKQQLEVVAGDVHGQLHVAKKHKEDANRRVEDVKLQLRFVQKTLEEQLLQLHKAESVEREAADAVGQLERHVRDWRAAAQVTTAADMFFYCYILYSNYDGFLCFSIRKQSCMNKPHQGMLSSWPLSSHI